MSFVDCKPELGIYMFCKCIVGPIIITLQCTNGCTSLILNQGVFVSCNGKFHTCLNLIVYVCLEDLFTKNAIIIHCDTWCPKLFIFHIYGKATCQANDYCSKSRYSSSHIRDLFSLSLIFVLPVSCPLYHLYLFGLSDICRERLWNDMLTIGIINQTFLTIGTINQTPSACTH